jgi:hypothetical protein
MALRAWSPLILLIWSFAASSSLAGPTCRDEVAEALRKATSAIEEPGKHRWHHAQHGLMDDSHQNAARASEEFLATQERNRNYGRSDQVQKYADGVFASAKRAAGSESGSSSSTSAAVEAILPLIREARTAAELDRYERQILDLQNQVGVRDIYGELGRARRVISERRRHLR